MVKYLVAGCQPWCLEVFNRVRALPGEWEFVGEPTRNVDSLGEALADAWPDPIYQHNPPRYVFFLHWSYQVHRRVFEAFHCVNFHCTQLPYGRGGHPIENLILAGRTETVITAHRMTSEIDAGPIYAVSAPVSLAGTKAQILDRFVEPCAELIRYIVRHEPTPKPQVGKPTYFKRLDPDAYQRFWAQREAMHV